MSTLFLSLYACFHYYSFIVFIVFYRSVDSIKFRPFFFHLLPLLTYLAFLYPRRFETKCSLNWWYFFSSESYYETVPGFEQPTSQKMRCLALKLLLGTSRLMVSIFKMTIFGPRTEIQFSNLTRHEYLKFWQPKTKGSKTDKPWRSFTSIECYTSAYWAKFLLTERTITPWNHLKTCFSKKCTSTVWPLERLKASLKFICGALSNGT